MITFYNMTYEELYNLTYEELYTMEIGTPPVPEPEKMVYVAAVYAAGICEHEAAIYSV